MAQPGPKHKEVIFMPEAGSELEATEGKPKWARVLAGMLAQWIENKTETLIK